MIIQMKNGIEGNKYPFNKLLVSLCMSTGTLFSYLCTISAPVKKYTNKEKNFIKAIVKRSAFPLKQIKCSKIRAFCKARHAV